MRRALIRSVLAAMLLGAAGAPALADTGEGAASARPCPENAAQIVFNVQAAIETGAPLDLNQAFRTAETAATLCPHSADIQGLSAVIFAALGSAVEGGDNQLLLLGKAYDAALRADQAYANGTGTVVTGADGAPVTLYMYGPAFSALETVILPGLADLATAPGEATSHIHPMFTEAAPPAACPYTEDRSSGVEYEARAIAWSAPVDTASKVALLSGRLTRLKAACAEKAGYLDWALAAYFNRAVQSSETQPGVAKAHARAALIHAADFLKAPPATRGSEADEHAASLSRMIVTLQARFPDL